MHLSRYIFYKDHWRTNNATLGPGYLHILVFLSSRAAPHCPEVKVPCTGNDHLRERKVNHLLRSMRMSPVSNRMYVPSRFCGKVTIFETSLTGVVPSHIVTMWVLRDDGVDSEQNCSKHSLLHETEQRCNGMLKAGRVPMQRRVKLFSTPASPLAVNFSHQDELLIERHCASKPPIESMYML